MKVWNAKGWARTKDGIKTSMKMLFVAIGFKHSVEFVREMLRNRFHGNTSKEPNPYQIKTL